MSASSDLFAYNSGILAGMDATAIAEHIRNKDISVQEAVDCIRQRVEQVNPRLNAVAFADFEKYVEGPANEGEPAMQDAG